MVPRTARAAALGSRASWKVVARIVHCWARDRVAGIVAMVSHFGFSLPGRLALSAVLCGLGAALMVAAPPCIAAEPAWPSGPYQYSVVEQDLTTVLQEFGRNTGLRLDVSAEVHGRVRGPWPQLAPREFLEHLCTSYGLEWYFDGFRVYVSAAKENASHLSSRGAVSFDRLEATLRDLGASDERFPLRAVKQSDLLLVSGPPQYVALVERTLAALKAGINPRKELPSVVTVYRGDQVAMVRLGGADGGGP
jgi:type II secretory pathway component GspD/PulD (secretin)